MLHKLSQEISSHHLSKLKIALIFAITTPRPYATVCLHTEATVIPAQKPAMGKGPFGCCHLLQEVASAWDAGFARPGYWLVQQCIGPSPGGFWEDNGHGDAENGWCGFVGIAFSPGVFMEPSKRENGCRR